MDAASTGLDVALASAERLTMWRGSGAISGVEPLKG